MWKEFIRIGEAVLRQEREESNRTPHRESSYLCSPETLGERETCDGEAFECDRAGAERPGDRTAHPRQPESSESPRTPPAILPDASDQSTQRQGAYPIFDHAEGTMELLLESGERVKIILDSHQRSVDTMVMRRKIVSAVRVTKREQVMIRKAARAAGQTGSFFMRECILKELRRAENPPMENVKEQITEEINRLIRMVSEEKESA